MAKKLAPMHPGEVLREEFLIPLNLSAGALAKACDLPRTRIERIAAETTGAVDQPVTATLLVVYPGVSKPKVCRGR